jgi:hypothetical protein
MEQELRQRRAKKDEKEGPPTVFGTLKKFDVYAKVHDDYKVKTDSGGCVSLVSLLFMGFLFLNELSTYLTVEIIDHIVVDTTLNQKLPISLNITFPHLRCDEVSVDTVDSAGENQIGVHGTLHQIELNAEGERAKPRAPVGDDECLSCLEAEEEDRCCNTCQELKDAYSEKGLPYFHVMDTAPQCKDSQGCQVFGDVLVNKVGGNVHVALGKSTIRDGKHVHEFNIRDVSDGFNTSHIIHKARFGSSVAGIASPLEGTSRIVRAGAGMFHYYIKLVPTLFAGRDGNVYTNQYAVTDSAKNVMVKKGELTGLPGIFLVYEFNPFMVEKVEKIVPFSHFLTQVCAIIGGVFTTAGLVDDFIYGGLNRFSSKGQ